MKRGWGDLDFASIYKLYDDGASAAEPLPALEGETEAAAEAQSDQPDQPDQPDQTEPPPEAEPSAESTEPPAADSAPPAGKLDPVESGASSEA